MDGQISIFDYQTDRLSELEAKYPIPRKYQEEEGWEHVSIELMARRLPTWEEMCLIKEIFWEDEEEVVQIHPRKSDYVNIVEALHLWRPKDGNWEKLNSK